VNCGHMQSGQNPPTAAVTRLSPFTKTSKQITNLIPAIAECWCQIDSLLRVQTRWTTALPTL
jgi:hypothetical protein